MAHITRFAVSREDVSVLLTELGIDHPEALYAPLLKTLLAAAATLDARAAERSIRQPRTTNLLIPGEHAEAFREWLTRAETRVAVDPTKAVVFARIQASRRERGLHGGAGSSREKPNVTASTTPAPPALLTAGARGGGYVSLGGVAGPRRAGALRRQSAQQRQHSAHGSLLLFAARAVA